MGRARVWSMTEAGYAAFRLEVRRLARHLRVTRPESGGDEP